MTTPITHTLCGSLSYTATFNTASIDPSTEPMSYDMSTRTFAIYSEDYALLGDNTIEV